MSEGYPYLPTAELHPPTSSRAGSMSAAYDPGYSLGAELPPSETPPGPDAEEYHYKVTSDGTWPTGPEVIGSP